MKKTHIPISVVWETTLACNMRCLHCGSSAGIQRNDELTTHEALHLCTDLQNLGTRLISLMGGEPFLRKDWKQIAMHIKDLGMNVTLMSNGLLIDESVIRFLRNLDPYAVTISLDGAYPETHNAIRGHSESFLAAVKSLTLLSDADLPTTAITTVHKKNFKDLPSIRDLLLNKGIAWQVQMATPIGRFPKELMLSKKEFYQVSLFIAATRKKYSTKELPLFGAHNFGYHSTILPNLMLLPWFGCQAGLTALGIQSNGGVKGCLSLPDVFIEDNIRKRSIKEIWNDPTAFSYNRGFEKTDTKNQCNTCKHAKNCKGGCVTVSYSLTGENHANPYCLKTLEETLFNHK